MPYYDALPSKLNQSVSKQKTTFIYLTFVYWIYKWPYGVCDPWKPVSKGLFEFRILRHWQELIRIKPSCLELEFTIWHGTISSLTHCQHRISGFKPPKRSHARPIIFYGGKFILEKWPFFLSLLLQCSTTTRKLAALYLCTNYASLHVISSMAGKFTAVLL